MAEQRTTLDGRFQIISDNGSLAKLQRTTMHLSTVELFPPGMVFKFDLDYNYESCLFTEDGNSEVLERYRTLEQALEGHKRLCKHYGLS